MKHQHRHTELAMDMANAERPYRDSTNIAVGQGLGDTAINIEQQASSAGNDVLRGAEGVRFVTFSEAQSVRRLYSDSFIDGALKGQLEVAGSKVYTVKRYLDEVEPTERDLDILNDTRRIAALYYRTTEVLARNLRLYIGLSGDQQKDDTRKDQIRNAKREYIRKLGLEAPRAANDVIEWCKDTQNRFPMRAMEYRDFVLDGSDVLDGSGESKVLPDVRPNFKIQRQIDGIFMMAYSDKRVVEKLEKTGENMSKRIYLNPDLEATPEIFEQILQRANAAGLSLQLKMYHRAPELATAYNKKTQGKPTGGLRGDGIVVYTNEGQADTVLAMVIKLSREYPGAFHRRKTSKIPQNVAEGIAIGDEPNVGGMSLTSHRALILKKAADMTKESGKTGEEARLLFRDLVSRISTANGVDSDNIAFNA